MNEPTGPAVTFLRPRPLARALALLALLLPASAGHSASVAAGSDVGRASRTDTNRIGIPCRSRLLPAIGQDRIGPDGIGGRSRLLQKTGPGSDRVRPESLTVADRAGSVPERTDIVPVDRLQQRLNRPSATDSK